MEVGKLNVSFRSDAGSSVSRKLRQKGQIPAVCYGPGHEPLRLALDPIALLKSLDPQKRTNTVIAMAVEGAPHAKAPTLLNVMLREWQRDAIRGDITHADFVRVDLTKDVRATVPLTLVGKSEGVKLGGTLHQVFRQLIVSCTPDKIPVSIEVDVEKLGMGEALHVRDVKLPAGVKPLVDGGQTVCTVTAPRAEKVTAAEAEAAEGAAAEGAAAAKPAEGDKGKAAAPAKGGDKAAADKGGDKKDKK